MFRGSDFIAKATQIQHTGLTFPTDDLPPIVIDPDLIYLSPEQKLDEVMDKELEANRHRLDTNPAKWKDYRTQLMTGPDVIPTHAQLIQNIQSKPLQSVQKDTYPVPFELYRKEVNYASIKRSVDVVAAHRVSLDDIIFVISLYTCKKLQRTQTYQILGSQLLTDLKDAFYCVSDHMPYSHLNIGSYFFMENTFYNDMRSPGALDTSQPVIDWYKARTERNEPCKFTNMVGTRMDGVKWSELQLSIGKRYLYCHQGDCEHIMIIEEVRSYDPVHDSLKKADFPMKIFQNKYRRRKCGVCEKSVAKQIAFHDPLSPESPVLYCDGCYNSLHPRGHGDLSVYPYIHEP